jgi:hypothetical protein
LTPMHTPSPVAFKRPLLLSHSANDCMLDVHLLHSGAAGAQIVVASNALEHSLQPDVKQE